MKDNLLWEASSNSCSAPRISSSIDSNLFLLFNIWKMVINLTYTVKLLFVYKVHKPHIGLPILEVHSEIVDFFWNKSTKDEQNSIFMCTSWNVHILEYFILLTFLKIKKVILLLTHNEQRFSQFFLLLMWKKVSELSCSLYPHEK